MFHIPSDLSEQALLYHAHECGTRILETKGHSNIGKAPEQGDESCFYFVGSIQSDLVVPGICVQKGQSLTSRSRVDYLIDAGKREVIFWAGPIDMLEVNTHTELIIFLGDHDELASHLEW